MKICIIGGIFLKGGAASGYLKRTPETTLAAGLRELGHQVTTLSHYDEADFDQFDVVHVHHLSWGALRLASDKSKTPFVFTPHDTSHMDGARFASATKCAMAYVISNADATVSLFRREAERIRDLYSVDGAIQQTIPNGIHTGDFCYLRSNTRGAGRPWQLIFSGQLIPVKRVDVLIEAMAKLRHDAQLTLVYQNAALEAELKDLATSLGVADRIRFAGKMQPRDLAALYQLSDILVLPSRSEALPSVISEAMLCGLPFIASAVGGIREQAAGFGSLIETVTSETLSQAIDGMIDRYDEHQAASFAMSEHARRAYSIDSMVQNHLDLYQRLAGTTPRRHIHWTRLANPAARVVAKRFGTAGPRVAPAAVPATK